MLSHISIKFFEFQNKASNIFVFSVFHDNLKHFYKLIKLRELISQSTEHSFGVLAESKVRF